MKQEYFNIVAKNISRFLKGSTFSIWLICFTLLSIHIFVGNAKATAPEVEILSPADGTEVDEGTSILFSATATDTTDGDEITSYIWNGPTGQLSDQSTFTTSTLKAGTHNIDLVVTDAKGEKETARVTVIVKSIKPTITITSPTNGSSYKSGDDITFEADVNDVQDYLEDIKVVWKSSIDSDFGSGTNFTISTLSAGKHTIEATATDTDGNTDKDSISITIDNQPPEASILSPEPNTTFPFGSLITFTGSVTDTEDGNITGDSLVWTSSQGGLIGKGENLSIKTLKSGIHIITLTAIDSSGAKDTATITITVGNAPPKATITAPTDGASFKFGDTITLKGTGTDDEDGTLPAASLVWTSSSSSEPLGSGTSLPVKGLPSGTHTITLTVTDSEGATDTKQIVVVVGNTLPVPTITSPADNSSHSYGKEIIFQGSASDAEDGEIPAADIIWSSDKDGILGSGESLSTTKLSINTHTITLTATDSEGAKGIASIKITVGNASPIALITKPANNSSHAFGKEIVFEGTGTDIEDETLDDNKLKWTSDIGGFLGYGASLTLSNLAVGTHKISLTVTDSKGATGVDTITITVGNASPIALIAKPTNNSSHAFGKEIVFEGTGTDTEDGELEDSKLKWSSDIGGFLGYGKSLTLSNLAVGTHKITLTVTDSNGLTGVDTINIIVGNASPVALITKPNNNSSHAFGKEIVFEGTGTDAEDGELEDSKLKWSSDIGGFLGYGKSLTLSNLAVGTHKITLTVTDSNSLTGVDTITITVGNASPVALITKPNNNSSHAFGKEIVFEGTGTDAEDGTLEDSKLKWTSDIGGFLGYGASLTLSNLAVGTHKITLTVTDNNGLTGVDTITIIVGNASPVALITKPANNSSYAFGKEIVFEGTGTDAEDGTLEDSKLKWTSDIGGFIGYGTSIPINDLAPGTHTITLTVTDSSGATGTNSIKIEIRSTGPVAIIISPADNSLYAFGEPISFSGDARDPEGSALDVSDSNMKWESTRLGGEDGATETTELIGYGKEIDSFKNLAVGKHTITFTVTDQNGRIGKDTITIIIRETAPVALITSPENNSSYPFGSEITFEGKGFDAAGLPLTGNNLRWSSRIEGSTTDELLGYGESLEAIKNFAIGKHTITLTVTVTDSTGKAINAIDTIIINITNTPPTVKITSPLNSAKFNLNEYIQFKGEANDPEDGELTDSSLVWTSNRAIKDSTGKETKQLGNGGQISINTLPIGETLITLTATDKNALSATASITVIIGTAVPPTVSILSPIDGSTFYINDYIEFKGEASDNTDGTLRGDSLVWTSKLKTSEVIAIGKGNTFTINTLTAGEHLVTLTAKNSAGLSGTDFIVITVGNHLPVPIITYPNKDKHTFDEGEIISFSGYATDEENGDLSGTSLSWTSDIDGYLGSGVKFSKALSAGEHTIRLTSKDNDGGIGKTTIKDSYGNSILLTINPTESSQPMTLENMEVSLPLGQVGEFTVSGGHPPYRYYKEYPYIASINIVGKKIKIIPQTIGSTTFNIVDHYNTTKILTLNVTDSLQNVPDSDAGTDQDVIEGDGVVLDGTASFKGNNGIESWSWVQVIDENSNEEDSYSNQKVVMLNGTSPKAMFVAPTLSDSSSLSSTSGSKLTFRLTVSDKDGNKSYDDVDINVSDNGISGYPQGVASFYTIDKKNHLGVRVVGDGDFVYINPQAPEFIKETINRPENMIYGVVDFKVKVEQGADANMIVYFPKPLGEDFTAYKYNSSKGWYEYSNNIKFSSDRKRSYLVISDGGEGDDDGLADGVISDPIAFGTKSKNPAIPETSSDGGGGGGGCFISTLLE